MRIQHNIAALNSYRNLSNNNTAVSKNLEKLSSGYKINRAGDDAAGLAISEKMRAQITGLETAQKNAQDGISLVQTAEGALTEVHSMLNRMVELANQSANGTYQDEVDRENLQKEIDSLVSEIDRISKSTNFNGINLLDGTMGGSTTPTVTPTVPEEIITGSMTNDGIKINNSGASDAKAEYEIDFAGVSFGKDGKVNLKFGNFDVDVDVTADMTAEEFAQAAADAINKSALGAGSPTGAAMLTAGSSDPVENLKFTATAEGTKITITASANGVDGTSGITSDTKVVLSEAKNDGGTTPTVPEEIGTPGISVDETDAMGLGSVAFEFAEGLSNEEKKAFVDAMGSDGFSIKFTGNVTNTTSDGAAGTITIDTNALNLPEGYKLQFVGADNSPTDVPENGQITVGTDGSKLNAGKEMQFKIVTESGEEVATIKIGALEKISSSSESSTVTITPPPANDPKIASARAGGVTPPEFTATDALTGSFGITDIDFSKFTGTISTDTEVMMSFATDASSGTLTIEIGGTTFTAAVTGTSGDLASTTLTLTSEDGGSITVTFGASPEVGTDKDAITSIKVGTLSPVKEETDPIKKGDKFEMDFSSISMPSDNDTLIINGVTITFGTDPSDVKIGDTIEETMKNIAEALNKDETFSKDWKVTADGGKLSFEAVKDDAGELKIDGASTWEAAKEVTASKVEDKPVSDVKTGDKYEMDFSTLSNPNNGDVLVIGDIEVTFQNGKAVAALANGTSINVTIGSDINETIQNLADELNKTAGFKENWKVTAENGKLTFEALKDGVTVPAVGDGTTWTGADKVTANKVDDTVVEPTDVPTLGEGITLQIGDTSDDYNRITVTIGDMSAAALGLEGLDISTQENAMAAIDKIKAAINTVSATRGDLGAIQNRLEHTINNLSVTTENMTAAESRIRDVDMAKEMMAYTKNNILVQSSQAMLAQANQIPQGVLQLLQ